MIALGRGLGLHVEPLTRELARSRHLDLEQGALVSSVELNGPARAAGVDRGDVIVQFGQHALRNVRDLMRAIREVEPGSTVDLVLSRAGESVVARIVRAQGGDRRKAVMQMEHAHELCRAEDARRGPR